MLLPYILVRSSDWILIEYHAAILPSPVNDKVFLIFVVLHKAEIT